MMPFDKILVSADMFYGKNFISLSDVQQGKEEERR